MMLLNQNENPLGPSPYAIKAMETFVTQTHRYDAAGIDLTQLLLNDTRRQSHHAHDLGVVIGHGADHLLAAASCYAVFAGGSGEVIEPILSYGHASRVINALAQTRKNIARVKQSPMTADLGIDLQAILSMITPRTKAIFITNPNNPTGLLLHPRCFNAWLPHIRPDILVVIDGAYLEFCDQAIITNTIACASLFPNVLLVRSFSKIFGLAGIRLGYGLGHKSLIERLMPWIADVPGPFAQVAGAAALGDEEHVRKTKQLASAFRMHMSEVVKKYHGIILPSTTHFVMLRMGTHSKTIHDDLLERDMVVKEIVDVHRDSWLRISMGTPEENQLFISTLEALLDKLN